jgi:hypothetical protein
VAAGDAFHFLEQDEAAHEGRGVAGGVADLRPAHRLVGAAQFAQVDVLLPGVFPEELAVEAALVEIDLHLDRGDADDAFQHVQLRAGEEGVLQRLVAADALGQLGIADAGGVTHAGQQTAGVLLANRTDQLAAQGAEGRGVHQHHAVLGQPDGAVLLAELDQVAQVVRLGVTNGSHLVSWSRILACAVGGPLVFVVVWCLAGLSDMVLRRSVIFSRLFHGFGPAGIAGAVDHLIN